MLDLQSIENWSKLTGGEPTVVTVCGEVIVIKPFNTKQVKPVITLIGNHLPLFYVDAMQGIQSLLVNGFDELISVIAIACAGSHVTKEAIENLPLDEMIKLAKAVYEVNKDFFTQKVMPVLKQMFPNLKMEVQVESQQVLQNGQTA